MPLLIQFQDLHKKHTSPLWLLRASFYPKLGGRGLEFLVVTWFSGRPVVVANTNRLLLLSTWVLSPTGLLRHFTQLLRCLPRDSFLFDSVHGIRHFSGKRSTSAPCFRGWCTCIEVFPVQISRLWLVSCDIFTQK